MSHIINGIHLMKPYKLITLSQRSENNTALYHMWPVGAGASPPGVPGEAGTPRLAKCRLRHPRVSYRLLTLAPWCRPSQISHWLPHTAHFKSLAPALILFCVAMPLCGSVCTICHYPVNVRHSLLSSYVNSLSVLPLLTITVEKPEAGPHYGKGDQDGVGRLVDRDVHT